MALIAIRIICKCWLCAFEKDQATKSDIYGPIINENGESFINVLSGFFTGLPDKEE